MADRARVSLEMSRETKDEWNDYIEDSHHQTLSGLVRYAVAREIDGDDEDDEHPRSPDIEEYVGAIIERLDGIEANQDGLSERLASVESEVRHDHRITRVASSVFEVLPTEGDVAQYEAGEAPHIEPGLAPSGEPRHIADAAEAERMDVERALRKLLDETPRVRMTERDGQEVYYIDE